MSTSFAAPALQLCAFALGCALIHAFRAHAASVTRVLTVCAVLAAVLVLLGASMAANPDDSALDEVSLYAAFS